jgi:hypothetical protein
MKITWEINVLFYALHQKFETNISRNETARPRSQNFCIHVSVSDLYFPTIGPPILLCYDCGLIVGIDKSLTDTSMKKLGTRLAVSFQGILGTVHLYIDLCIPL